MLVGLLQSVDATVFLIRDGLPWIPVPDCVINPHPVAALPSPEHLRRSGNPRHEEGRIFALSRHGTSLRPLLPCLLHGPVGAFGADFVATLQDVWTGRRIWGRFCCYPASRVDR